MLNEINSNIENNFSIGNTNPGNSNKLFNEEHRSGNQLETITNTTEMNDNISTNNYFNPNMNSYINIFTINLGCNDETGRNDRATNDRPSTNSHINNNKIDLNIDSSVNTSYNHINNNVNNPTIKNTQIVSHNLTKIISRKLMLYEYQKYLKGKGMNNTVIQVNTNSNNNALNLTAKNNVITYSDYLNITNGECNIINPFEKEQEKEQEPNITQINSNDPFKISFEDSFGGNNTCIQNIAVAEENDIHKLNLDLDHFFNMDNL